MTPPSFFLFPPQDRQKPIQAYSPTWCSGGSLYASHNRLRVDSTSKTPTPTGIPFYKLPPPPGVQGVLVRLPQQVAGGLHQCEAAPLRVEALRDQVPTP